MGSCPSCLQTRKKIKSRKTLTDLNEVKKAIQYALALHIHILIPNSPPKPPSLLRSSAIWSSSARCCELVQVFSEVHFQHFNFIYLWLPFLLLQIILTLQKVTFKKGHKLTFAADVNVHYLVCSNSFTSTVISQSLSSCIL